MPFIITLFQTLCLANLTSGLVLLGPKMSINFIWFFFITFIFFSSVYTLSNSTTDSLDGFTRDLAFKALAGHRARTGALCRAIVPANLSGIEVSILRLRSGRLWKSGAANFGHFGIPSRTRPMPHVKRLALVYQDLGNWSSHYYSLPGYSLVTSVVGFMVYDASDTSPRSTTRLSLITMRKPILIQFHNLTLDQGMKSKTRCVAFAANGTVSLTEMRSLGVCYTRDQGHFSIVVPLKKEQSLINLVIRYLWVIGLVLGLIGIVLVGYVGMVTARHMKAKKIQEMERQAEEDLVLENRWVRGSKLPSAAGIRTTPSLENGFPCQDSSDHFR